jgi:hypothetical protein
MGVYGVVPLIRTADTSDDDETGGAVRTVLKWSPLPIAVIAIAAAVAFQTKTADTALPAELANDLDLVAAASDLELAPMARGATFVSAVEQVEKPAQRLTPSPTRARGTKAPPPEAVAVIEASSEGAAVAETVLPASAVDSGEVRIEAPEPSDLPPVPRPRPVEPRFPVGEGPMDGAGAGGTRGSGDDGTMGTGRDGGNRGTIVIRGGRTGRDDCAIHDRRAGRPPVHISINQRSPTRTFPGTNPTFPRR